MQLSSLCTGEDAFAGFGVITDTLDQLLNSIFQWFKVVLAPLDVGFHGNNGPADRAGANLFGLDYQTGRYFVEFIGNVVMLLMKYISCHNDIVL